MQLETNHSTSRTLEDYEENYADSSLPTYIVVLKSLGEFIGVFGASFLVGSVLGCATALLTKFTHIRNFPTLEATLFVLVIELSTKYVSNDKIIRIFY